MSTPIWTWLPSISWSRALPMSCSRPARRASVTFTPISPASRPASQATSMLWVRAFWPKLVRYFRRPMSLMRSGCRPWMPSSITARSPSRFICSSRSWRHFSTVSSMRAGWMRPSPMRRSSVMRATSRRVWSKEDRVMASGVSSMIRSTPVAVSRARILRPSRPMMRPFISSLGSGTTLTVVSLQWSAAQRLMAWPMRLRAMPSQFSFKSVS